MDIGLNYHIPGSLFNLAGGLEYSYAPVQASTSLSLVTPRVGGGLQLPLARGIGLRAYGLAGYYFAAYNDLSTSVTDPYVIIGIHADNRFDPVRAQLDRVLDVNAAIAKELEHERDVVKRKPGELMPLLAQAYTMRNTLQFTEALQLLDSAIAKASGPEAKKQFSDRDRYFVWLLDTRSQALADLGRWDDAVNQELTASHLSEYSGGNVSQIINLANLYDDLGRPLDAKRTLVGLAPSGASGYGNMQVAIEKMRIALQLGDQPEAARQLAYLRAHQADSESTYQNALIFADHADEAAQVLMGRLANPEERADALLEVQHYRRSARDELLKDFSSRWEAVLARTDVRAAIDKVGRVESYPLLRQAH